VRRDFVANISHELKTPVGALALLAETVEEAADDPEAVLLVLPSDHAIQHQAAFLAGVERAVAAGVDARLDVWQGMPHGFIGTIGQTQAAADALSAIGKFLSSRLATS